MKKSKTPSTVEELIKKLEETAKCGGLMVNCYTIRIHKDNIKDLIKDLKHVYSWAGKYENINYT